MSDERKIAWPAVENAMKRVNLRIDGLSSADSVDMNVTDLIVIMREIGRLTDEAKQRSQPRVGIYERLEQVEAENAKLKAALKECADDLEAELDSRHSPAMRAYPRIEREFQRAMEPVRRARVLIAAGRSQGDGE